jgi:hypothetical protein
MIAIHPWKRPMGIIREILKDGSTSRLNHEARAALETMHATPIFRDSIKWDIRAFVSDVILQRALDTFFEEK